MTAKSKSQLVRQDVDDDILRASITFYRADASATPPNHARMQVHLTNGQTIDRPFSDYASLTAGQKANLAAAINSLWNETIILEGFT